MSTSAVPAVIDYLVATFSTAVSALTYNGSAVQVIDGPAGADGTDMNLVYVGSGSDADASDAAVRDFVAIGAQRREEEFVVVCYVACRVGGTNQKATRDAAFGVFSALETAIRADLTLGGTVAPYPAEITTQNVKQTPPGESAKGRYTRIEFGVRVRNRY